jgi:hypothetical protein
MYLEVVNNAHSLGISLGNFWSSRGNALVLDSILRRLIRIGPPGEIRTPDTQVRSLVLYPAELRAEGVKNMQAGLFSQEKLPILTPSRDNPFLSSHRCNLVHD